MLHLHSSPDFLALIPCHSSRIFHFIPIFLLPISPCSSFLSSIFDLFLFCFYYYLLFIAAHLRDSVGARAFHLILMSYPGPFSHDLSLFSSLVMVVPCKSSCASLMHLFLSYLLTTIFYPSWLISILVKNLASSATHPTIFFPFHSHFWLIILVPSHSSRGFSCASPCLLIFHVPCHSFCIVYLVLIVIFIPCCWPHCSSRSFSWPLTILIFNYYISSGLSIATQPFFHFDFKPRISAFSTGWKRYI
jgi:hypothetical protein